MTNRYRFKGQPAVRSRKEAHHMFLFNNMNMIQRQNIRLICFDLINPLHCFLIALDKNPVPKYNTLHLR